MEGVIKDPLISNLAYTHLTAADITSGTASDRVHGCVTSNDTTQFRRSIRYTQVRNRIHNPITVSGFGGIHTGKRKKNPVRIEL